MWPYFADVERYIHNLLIAIAYGLMLPAIAVLHVRHRSLRDSGAILGTIAGTAAVVVGLGASVEPQLRPTAFFILGMWWWTIGKMWTETGLFGRYLGPATAALGVIAIGVAFFDVANVFVAVTFIGFPGIDVFTPMRLAMAAWLFAVAAVLPRPNIP